MKGVVEVVSDNAINLVHKTLREVIKRVREEDLV